ncbi:MAG TPA: hypothetical protein DDW89_10205 [Gammaproteobacteria bacterium]|nr:hypothetical protein [Gammaproteobacteria bacterium]
MARMNNPDIPTITHETVAHIHHPFLILARLDVKNRCILNFLIASQVSISGRYANLIDVTDNTEIELHISQFVINKIDHKDTFCSNGNIFTKLFSRPFLWQISGKMRFITINFYDANIIFDRHATVSEKQARDEQADQQRKNNGYTYRPD